MLQIARPCSDKSGRNFNERNKGDTPEKYRARSKIIEIFPVEEYPQLTIITFPAAKWIFEYELLDYRDENWRQRGYSNNTRIIAFETDKSIYSEGLLNKPSDKNILYYNQPLESFVFSPGYRVDAVWADYSGCISLERVKWLRNLWINNIENALIITGVKSSRNLSDGTKLDRGYSHRFEETKKLDEWLSWYIPGKLEHYVEYGRMVQYAVSKKAINAV